jgi:hypothetical protein
MIPARTVLTRDIVAPDLVLPAQFFLAPSIAERSPETRLMLAVLEDAVLTLLRHSSSDTSQSRRLVRDVIRWVDTRRSNWPFSFENICAVLGFDAAAVRSGLRRIHAGTSAPSLPLERHRFIHVGRRVAARRHRVSLRRLSRRQVEAATR